MDNPTAIFVLHQGDFLVRLHVDDAAVTEEGQLAVIGHGDPTVSDARRGLDGFGGVVDRVAAIARVVPDVPRAVDRVCDPDFAFVRGHPDAVAVPFPLPRVAGQLHALDHLAGFDIANLEADEIVDVDVNQAGVMVDGQRTHHLGEGHVAQHLPARHVDDGHTRLAVLRARHRAEDTELAIRRQRQIVGDGRFGNGELAQVLSGGGIDVVPP